MLSKSLFSRAVVLGFLILFVQVISAGEISIITSISTEIMTKNTSQIQVKLVNSGDEPAYNVKLSLISDHFTAESVYVGKLKVNTPFQTNMSVFGGALPGNYLIVLLTEYTDANGYPFSAVSPIILTYKKPGVSRVTASLPDLTLGNAPKELPLILKNLDNSSHELTVKLILPLELKGQAEKTITIGPKQEERLKFRISNLAGLEGSSYVILASVEYEDELHHATFGRGMVNLGNVRLQNKSHPSSNLELVGYLILLISIFIVFSYLYPNFKRWIV